MLQNLNLVTSDISVAANAQKDSLIYQCMVGVSRDVTQWTTTSGAPQRVVVDQALLDPLCPTFCNDRGTCSAGKGPGL